MHNQNQHVARNIKRTENKNDIIIWCDCCQCDLMGTTRCRAQNTHQKQPICVIISRKQRGNSRAHTSCEHIIGTAQTHKQTSRSHQNASKFGVGVSIESRGKGASALIVSRHTKQSARSAKVSVSHKLRLLLVDMQDALRNWSCCRTQKKTEQPAQ
jgi:hypothetical protein